MTPVWVDIVPVGLLRATGGDAVDFFHRLSTNDMRPLREPGRALSTVFTNEKGRAIDWVEVWSHAGSLWVRTSAGRAPSVRAWLERFIIMEDVTLSDETEGQAMLVLQGTGAAALGSVTVATNQTRRADDLTWTRGLTAYGERLEAVGPVPALEAARTAASAKGAIAPPPEAWEQSRILAGVPSPAAELADEVNPLELRLGPLVIAWNKGCYIGQEVISRMDSYNKVPRVLMGWSSPAAAPPDLAEARIRRDGKLLGRVTSQVSANGATVGLGVVRREDAVVGPVQLVTPTGTTLEATLEDRPFWRPN